MSNTRQMIMQSPLGELLLETDGIAITRVHFCEAPISITQEVHPLLFQAKQELENYFLGKLFSFGLPIAQKGTDFQQRVWQQLQKIEYGHTISYKKLAILLGDEKCIRAAGTANGKNELAIIVPCHRVIGSNGELVGYAGGIWRKQWLLQHEATMRGIPTQGKMF